MKNKKFIQQLLITFLILKTVTGFAKENKNQYFKLNEFYKTSLFFKDGTQIKPIGCMGDTVVVLSDYNRGPGLYNLFKLQKKEYQKLIH